MKLIDTSAWIDYLRGSDSRATSEVRRLLKSESAQVVMCEPVAMELLAGATTEVGLLSLERLVNGLPQLPVDPTLDFRSAASIYRTARSSGKTIRSLTDCLIGAIALRHGATLLHKDMDFEIVAEFTELDSLSLR